MAKEIIQTKQSKTFLATLQLRFEKNITRHPNLNWSKVQQRLESSPKKLQSLMWMEETGGEPDVVGFKDDTQEFIFVDCSPESPSGRRSLCFDREALDSRKENKPVGCVLELAAENGVELLSEAQYRHLQTVGVFDAKTSSWIQTPADIRKLGGALFADYRYKHVFVYHNGAQSYYAARGFRAMLLV